MKGALNIAETVQTPEVRFDLDSGNLSISGKSYPENVRETYAELMLKLNEYKSFPNSNTNVDFKWLYYNTATSKIIVEILRLLKAANTVLTVNWYCRKDFLLMIERAELFSDVLDMKINIISE